jgi:nicotinamidase-related amidase
MRHPTLLNRETSALVVVDMQEPFLRAIHGREALTENVLRLVRGAQVLGVPVLATTQYAERMGASAPEVAAALAEATGTGEAPLTLETVAEIDKLCFSCAGAEPFTHALAATGRRQVVLCGVETHICVSMTAHDLQHAGYQVHVVADAVSARTLERHKLGMERIRDAGVKPAATETVLYEWLREAGTPEFKAILQLVR